MDTSTNRFARAAALVVALAFVFGPAIALALGARTHVEQFENRRPAPPPRASDGWDALDGVAPWATDRIPGRRQAVTANGWIDFYLFRRVPLVRRDQSDGRADGSDHAFQRAPLAVVGRDGFLFYGRDFNLACRRGDEFARRMAALTRLADAIERSGRRVVITVAPNKSTVMRADLPVTVPHGDCALDGMAKQRAAIRAFDDPRYVDLLPPLDRRAAAGDDLYLRRDTHWTTTGATIYARAMAGRLLPRGAPLPRTNRVPQETGSDLGTLIGVPFQPEHNVVDSIPPTGVTLAGPDRWRTEPGPGVVRGRTLILGDSFSGGFVPAIAPVFAEGRFIDFSRPEATLAEIIAAVRRADTVVIEVVERNVARGDWRRFAEPDALKALADSAPPHPAGPAAPSPRR